MSIRPLDGVTVVSLEHAVAAPFCTRQLADLGARVIKVERPEVGTLQEAMIKELRECHHTLFGQTVQRRVWLWI